MFGMEIPFGPYLALAALGYFFGLKNGLTHGFNGSIKLAINLFLAYIFYNIVFGLWILALKI